MAIDTLTKGQVRKVSATLRADSRKLPKMGYCVRFGRKHDGDRYAKEVCHDGRGYFIVRSPSAVFEGRRSKRRK